MKPSTLLEDPTEINQEYVEAWNKIDKALGTETDPDISMTQALLNTLVVMAEKIESLERDVAEHERSITLLQGRGFPYA